MKIHEYQAKQIFARHGIPIPKGALGSTPAEVESAAASLIRETESPVVVVKAQIHAGGRGKAGGIRVAHGPDEARRAAEVMIGHPLVTHQTGPDGQTVRWIYVEQGLAIERELYVALVLDRDVGRVAVIASTEGGVDIEQVARTSKEKIRTVHVDPALGLAAFQARRLGFALGLGKEGTPQFVNILQRMYDLFVVEDCSLCETNPLVVTKDGQLVALDAKMNLDDNAEIRHPSWGELRDLTEEDPIELEAKRAGLSYVSLDGDIGCLVNGAGLAMSTMDIIQHYGGSPANFLDVGGGATREQVTKAFDILLRSPKVKSVFVNIFGGIMQCDVIASGILAATRDVGMRVPLVVRLEGTNAEQGRALLAASALRIHAVSSMAEGAESAVKMARSGR